MSNPSSFTSSDPLAATLPALAFGDALARVETDLAAFGDRMSGVASALRGCKPLGPANRFRQKSATITINGLTLAAGACTPMRVEVGESADLMLLIPFAGEGTFHAGGVAHHWQAGARGLFVPGTAGGGTGSLCSVLLVNPRRERLQASARGLLGLAPDAKVEFLLGPARAVDLRQGGMAFGDVFRHLCGLIDAYQGEPDALEAVGLDEQFYRHLVLLLRPGLMLEAASRKPAQAMRVLDPVCGYIMAHLHAPMTLTDLEGASGLSRRSLQYGFWQRYACTPMQWVRGQRLEKVRSMLIRADSRESVTSAALQSGFSNLGAFSAYYRERFGEQPSETLRRTGARDA